MKRGPQVREKKTLSVTGLLDIVRAAFKKITSPINGRKLSLTRSQAMPPISTNLNLLGMTFLSLSNPREIVLSLNGSKERSGK